MFGIASKKYVQQVSDKNDDALLDLDKKIDNHLGLFRAEVKTAYNLLREDGSRIKVLEAQVANLRSDIEHLQAHYTAISQNLQAAKPAPKPAAKPKPTRKAK